MNGLARHIEILLLNNDCVVVPRLGGFVAHYTTARYDESDNIYIPPIRAVGFNPQLAVNDSQLAQAYVETYDMSYPQAIEKLEEDVEKMKAELNNSGEYELHGIGRLYINQHGKIEFSPCNAGLLSPELYGLDSIEAIHLRNKTKKSDERKTTSAEIYSLPPRDNTNIKELYLRRTIAVAVSILAVLILTFPGNGNLKKHEIQSGVIQNILPKNITIGKPDITRVKKHAKEVKEIKQKDVKTTAYSPVSLSYCIVLASDVKQKNAELFIQEMHKKGYSKTRLLKKKSTLRVVYGSYKTHEDAYKMLNKLRSEPLFEQAWVMKNK